ncbi:MAG: DUF2834 domain-containing protein [Nannocystales bacterium]
MGKTTITWSLGVIGWVASYAMFGVWLAANDWDFFGGWVEAFTASDFATGLLFDLVAVTVMMVVVAVWERRRIGGRWSAAVVGALTLSVSMSLTIYLVALWRTRSAGAPQ